MSLDTRWGVAVWNAGRVRIDFRGSPDPTLGVEWELGLVDRRSRDLRNDADELFAAAAGRLPDPAKLHKELLRNTAEVNRIIEIGSEEELEGVDERLKAMAD